MFRLFSHSIIDSFNFEDRHILVFESLVESGEAHVGAELLEKDLHKDSAG